MPDSLPQTRNPTGARVYWEPNAKIFRSPETGSEQRVDIWGRWQLVFDYDGLEEDEALSIVAFLENVGLSTAFTVLHPSQREPKAVWAYGSYSPTVNGGSQTGKTLVTAGWPSNTLVFKTGDVVELSTGQVVRMNANITSTGTAATLTFSQMLRQSPANGSAVTVVNPKFTVLLNRPVQVGISVPTLQSFSVEMREDI